MKARASVATGAWRGKVEHVDADGRAHVRAKRLNRDRVFGPCPVLEHAGAPLAAGDAVLVMHLENDPNQLIVLGRL